MHRHRLDVVVKGFADRVPRRAALARLAGGAAAGLLGSLGISGRHGRRVAAQSATPPADAKGYVVIRRYQLKPEASTDDLVAKVDEGFVPIVRAIPGLQQYLFVDAGNGAHLTIGLYDDPSGAEQSTRDAAGWAAENVAQLIEGPPEVTEGWVRIHVEA